MPSQPFWHARLDAILAHLRGLDAEYLDRHAVERSFAVGERRARQLMGGLHAIQVGNAMAVRRASLLERLEKRPGGSIEVLSYTESAPLGWVRHPHTTETATRHSAD